jgi:hypothetical protein
VYNKFKYPDRDIVHTWNHSQFRTLLDVPLDPTSPTQQRIPGLATQQTARPRASATVLRYASLLL